jgi:hypothetical protein
MIIAKKIINLISMEMNSKNNIEEELNIQKRNLELLNFLETRCEGLENLLCKNVINVISKKIDTIEKRFSNEQNNRNSSLQSPAISKKEIPNIEGEKIAKLNNNLEIIKNSFKNIFTAPDSKSSEIIGKKIEENYKLLDELEKTNRPIFTKTTEISNRMYVEDKIKEMDNKLSELFSTSNVKKSPENNESENFYSIRQNDKEIKRNSYTSSPMNINFAKDTLPPISENNNIEMERERKKKELYNKLNSTEKRIKEIAGNILKNF